MEFKIAECNFERLEKKLVTIRNKCLKYGNDFSFSVVGEKFEKVNKVMQKFIVVDVSGTAKVNNWEFIGTIEHEQHGNIIKCITDLEIPAHYFTAECVCEHCKSDRVRKNTYLIRNTETGEFKQVGKTCLQDFTNGLSAEAVAGYISLYNELITSEAPLPGFKTTVYYPIEDVLKYAAEVINVYGYIKSSEGENSTKFEVYNQYCYDYYPDCISPSRYKEIRFNREKTPLNFERPESVATAENALQWIRNREITDRDSTFLHNLSVIASNDYVKLSDFGFLVALIPAYNKEMGRIKEAEERRKQESKSNFVGDVGDRIIVNIVSAEVVTSWDTDFGTTYINKLIDDNENIYIWKSSKNVVTAEINCNVKMTVKAHNEYNGTKQTEVQRVTKVKK